MSPQAEEIWAIIKENNVQLAKLEAFQKETTEQMRKTDVQMRKNDEKLTRMGVMLDNIGKNQGFVAEEFFFNSLVENPYLGSIHFDDVTGNDHKHRGQTQEEYDIFLTNKNAVAVIEVKYKLHENDLNQLERKMRNFKKLYPMYENHNLYGAIAAFHIYKEAKNAALKRGFFVLQRSGKIITTEIAENVLVM